MHLRPALILLAAGAALAAQAPASPAELQAAADKLAAARDWKGLSELAQAYVQAHPKEAAGWYQLGRAQVQQKDAAGLKQSSRKLHGLDSELGVKLLDPEEAFALMGDPALPILKDLAPTGFKSATPPVMVEPSVRRDGIPHLLLLDLVVDPKGNVTRATLLDGPSMLGHYAESKAKLGRFEPPAGTAVPFRLKLVGRICLGGPHEGEAWANSVAGLPASN